jgi:hypothetical protein
MLFGLLPAMNVASHPTRRVELIARAISAAPLGPMTAPRSGLRSGWLEALDSLAPMA